MLPSLLHRGKQGMSGGLVKMLLANPKDQAAGFLSATNGEVRVRASGVSASQAAVLTTLRSGGNQKMKEPRLRQTNRARAPEIPNRTPCESVPSMPARFAYACLKFAVFWRLRACTPAS